jgi:hypothetical protein
MYNTERGSTYRYARVSVSCQVLWAQRRGERKAYDVTQVVRRSELKTLQYMGRARRLGTFGKCTIEWSFQKTLTL